MSAGHKTKKQLLAEIDQLREELAVAHSNNSRDKSLLSDTIYKTLINQSPISNQILSPDGKTVHVNPTWEKLFGFTQSEAVGRPGTEWIAPQHRELVMEHMLSGYEEPYEVLALRKDGTTFPAEIQGKMIHYQDRNVRVIALRDITDRKQAEAKSLEQAHLLEVFSKYTHDCIVLLDRDFNFIRVNEAYAKACNRDVSEFPGHNHFEFYPSELIETFQNVVKTKEPFHIQARPFTFPDHPDWDVTYWNLSLIPALDENGEVEFLLFTLSDVTKYKQAESALQKSEERFALAMRGANDGLWDRNLETGEAYYSPRWKAMLGYEENELDAHLDTWATLIHPDDRDWVLEKVQSYIEGRADSYEVEMRMQHKDGHEVVVLSRAYLVHRASDGKPVRLVGTHVDITERKMAERLLEASERRYRDLYDNSPLGYQSLNAEGRLVEANPMWCRMLGYERDEIIGKWIGDLLTFESAEKFKANFPGFKEKGEFQAVRLDMIAKDGHVFSIELDGRISYDEQGNFKQIHCVITDITEHKKLEQQLLQAQKMEAIGTLVGGIAHDFNNMLAGMTGNLYLAKQRAREMPDVVQKLDNVESIAFRAADMIQRLLTFARKDMVSMRELPLNPFIEEALKFLRSSVPENIDIHQEICSDPLQIIGDSTQLHQMLMNIVNNARDAVEGVDEPRITIRLETFQTDDSFIESYPYFTAGLYAHLSIEDNGCGIPEHHIEHMFEPFFTTKEQGKGTGLGLAMVFGSIKTHHGFIKVESIEGEGSTFHIYIPLLKPEETASAPLQEEGSAEVSEGHGETILLVDDEQHILETGKEVLGALGYRVLTASNGQQAVEIFKAHSEEIDLYIFDVVMPVMGGDKAAQRIRRINPNVKIIFSTGYDKNTQTILANETVLSKPFSIIEMSHLIRRKLKEKGTFPFNTG